MSWFLENGKEAGALPELLRCSASAFHPVNPHVLISCCCREQTRTAAAGKEVQSCSTSVWPALIPPSQRFSSRAELGATGVSRAVF